MIKKSNQIRIITKECFKMERSEITSTIKASFSGPIQYRLALKGCPSPGLGLADAAGGVGGMGFWANPAPAAPAPAPAGAAVFGFGGITKGVEDHPGAPVGVTILLRSSS